MPLRSSVSQLGVWSRLKRFTSTKPPQSSQQTPEGQDVDIERWQSAKERTTREVARWEHQYRDDSSSCLATAEPDQQVLGNRQTRGKDMTPQLLDVDFGQDFGQDFATNRPLDASSRVEDDDTRRNGKTAATTSKVELSLKEDCKKYNAKTIRMVSDDAHHRRIGNVGSSRSGSPPELCAEEVIKDEDQFSGEQRLQAADVTLNRPWQARRPSGTNTRQSRSCGTIQTPCLPFLQTAFNTFENSALEDDDCVDAGEARSVCNSSLVPDEDEQADDFREAMLKETKSPWLSDADGLAAVGSSDETQCSPTGEEQAPAGSKVERLVGALENATKDINRPLSPKYSTKLLRNPCTVSEKAASYHSTRRAVACSARPSPEISTNITPDISPPGTPCSVERPAQKLLQLEQQHSIAEFRALLAGRLVLSKTARFYRIDEWVRHLEYADNPGLEMDELERPGSPAVRIQRLAQTRSTAESTRTSRAVSTESPPSRCLERVDSYWEEFDGEWRQVSNPRTAGVSYGTDQAPSPCSMQTNNVPKHRQCKPFLPILDTTLVGQHRNMLAQQRLVSSSVYSQLPQTCHVTAASPGPASPQLIEIDEDDIPLSYRRSLLKDRRASGYQPLPTTSRSQISPLSPRARRTSQNNLHSLINPSPQNSFPRRLASSEEQCHAQQLAHRDYVLRAWHQDLASDTNRSDMIPEFEEKRDAMMVERQARIRAEDERKRLVVEKQRAVSSMMKYYGPELEEAHRREMRKMQRNVEIHGSWKRC